MVTTIGNSDDKVRIGDNATPGSGTYEIYLNGNPSESDSLPKVVSDTNLPQDESVVYDGFILQSIFNLKGILSSNTDFRNMKIARFAWAKANDLLYLSIKNESGAEELAVAATYADPTTLIQMRGQLARISTVYSANNFDITILFKHYARAT